MDAVIVRSFNILISSPVTQKAVNKGISELKHIIGKITEIYRLLHLTTTKYVFPPEAHGIFFKTEKILVFKTLSNQKKIPDKKTVEKHRNWTTCFCMIISH